MLDLTNPEILQRIEVKSEALTPRRSWNTPRNIAVEARSNGFEALFPGSIRGRSGSKNLVVFLDRSCPESPMAIELQVGQLAGIDESLSFTPFL